MPLRDDFEFISIRRDRLLAGATYVQAEQRNAFFATLLVGSDGVVEPNSVDESIEPRSCLLNEHQLRELRSKIDDSTWAVVRAIVTNAVDDVGTVDWPKIKELTGVTKWAQFAKGRMGGLHRSLRKIAGVNAGAVLLWEGDGWLEDGQGDYSAGTVCIDGPAVRILRDICGLNTSSS